MIAVSDGELRLPFRAPLAAEALLGWLAVRAVPGVEEVDGDVYRRSLRLPGGPGVVELELRRRQRGLPAVAGGPRDGAAAGERCRRLLDLDADPGVVAEHLRRRSAPRSAGRAAPGLRVPGAVDGAELAVRAVLGQQVSLAAARTAAGRLVAAHGEALPARKGR